MAVCWYELECAACGQTNMVNGGDMSDMTAHDIETFKCCWCRKVSQIPECEGEPCTLAKDQTDWDEEGKKRPR